MARQLRSRAPKRRPRTYSRMGKYRSRNVQRRLPYRTRPKRVTSTLIPRTPFPDLRCVRHVYNQTVSIPAAAGAGLTSYYNLRANGMYDPDFTGVGHQPLYYDEMASMYNSYTVMRAYVVVRIEPTSGSSIYLGIIQDDDLTVAADPTKVMEQYGGTISLPSNRNNTLILRKRYDAAKKHHTTTKAILADNDQKISSLANPPGGVVQYFNVWAAPLNSGATLSATRFNFTIYYDAVWRDRREAIQS